MFLSNVISLLLSSFLLLPDGALRLGVRAHLPEQPVGAEPAKYHLWPATAQRRQHGRHSGLSGKLRW